LKYFFTFLVLLFFSSCAKNNLLKKPNQKAPIGDFLNEFNLGFTGYAWEFQSNENSSVWLPSMSLLLDGHVDTRIKNVDYAKFNELRETIDESKYFVMWITKHWNPSYFNIKDIQRAIDYGKIPVFVYWYFGDDFATHNTQSVISKERKNYAKMNQKVVNFINQLKGEVIMILEPEFNKQNILDNPLSTQLFISTMNYSLDYLRQNISKDIHLYLGLSMNDNGSRYKNENYVGCGYEHCALGDKDTWNKSIKVLQQLSNKTDIVAFSMMLSPLTRALHNPDTAHAYKNERLGIGYIPKRINNLSYELHTQLNKPVFLSHLVMASGTWNDINNNQKVENNEIDPNGWNREIYNTYSRFDYAKFKSNGLFGMALMNLFDDPKHDLGGYNYFLQNEHHLGLISTAVDPESKQAKNGKLHFKSFNNIRLLDLIYKKH